MSKNTTCLIAGVIGEGKMAQDCIAEMIRRDDTDVHLVVTSTREDIAGRRLRAFCARHSVKVISTEDPNSRMTVQNIAEVAPDVIFNINGFSILGRELIEIPVQGVVNFHNGPLPAYAGMNIPTWAIWQGEREHGVAWHYIDEGIDTGDVIARARFPVDDRETAATLTMKCIIEGTNLFQQVLGEIVAGSARGVPQQGKRSYFRKLDIPNEGYVDVGWPTSKIDRLLRALDFHPFPNLVEYPKLRFGAEDLRLARARISPQPASPTTGRPGTIVSLDERSMVILCRDGKLVVDALVAPEGGSLNIETAAKRFGLAWGKSFG